MNRGRQSATRVPGLRRPTQDEIRMTVDLHEMPGGDLASLNSVVSSLFGPILGLDESLLRNRVDLSRFFDESVPVQAPPMIIEAVSEIKTIEEPAGPCAICQEETRMGDVLRQFRAPCNHSFHRSCIDPWLERNVHCPVCRRDIRELPVV